MSENESNDIKITRIGTKLDIALETLDKLTTKVETIEAAMNRGRGIFTASVTIAGLVGAGATAFIEWLHK